MMSNISAIHSGWNKQTSQTAGYASWQIISIMIILSFLCIMITYFVTRAGESSKTMSADTQISTLTAPIKENRQNSTNFLSSTPPNQTPISDQNKVEVCGLGIFQATAEDPDGSAQISEVTRIKAQRRGFDLMNSNPDKQIQASGLLLQARAAQQHGNDLGNNAAYQLARLASQTDNPAIYATALEACRSYRPSSNVDACSNLNAGQWARLEPDNAAPWLLIAQDAHAKGDNAGMNEAIYRVSRAQKIEWHANNVTALAAQALPKEISPLDHAIITQEAWATQAGWKLPSYRGLTAFCESSDDVNKGQVCNDVANLFVKAGGNPTELQIGIRIGRNVGWDRQRLENLRLQRDVLSRALANAPFYKQPYSCASIDKLVQWSALQQRMGELGAVRAFLQSTGQSLQEATLALKRSRIEPRPAKN